MLAAESTDLRSTMTHEQCAMVLRTIGWGVIAVAEPSRDGAVPIAVPTTYAYDGAQVYVAMSAGRKRNALDKNPRLCLTITDVHSFESWRSVALIGKARWITDDGERARAISAFVAQRRPGQQRLTSRFGARLAQARILAIETDELHGFTCGDPLEATAAPPAPPREPEPRMPLPEPIDVRSAHVADAMNAIRQIVRALRASQDSTVTTMGLSAAQLFVLREIAKATAPTVTELARRTATAQSSVSEVLTRLEARGLVTRQRMPSDRRRSAIALTAKARDVLGRAPETVQERMLAAFGRLSADQRQSLADGLVRWNVEAGLDAVAATMFFEPLFEAGRR
jgi:DNA-binding MarR family transcriptional regulator/nitroimidazol reductase NimA-like FMN-containing flavoprotein (pyridoxamine 5'-phosphate oxidase superfamily)